jgi:hypothetical protein
MFDPYGMRSMAGRIGQMTWQQETGGPAGDELDDLAKALAASGSDDVVQRLLDWAERRRKVRQTQGERAGLSTTQRAYVASRPSDEAKLGALSTATMVNRNATLKTHGYDPQAPYMRWVGPQRDGETEEEYLYRVRLAESKYRGQRGEAKQANLATYQRQKEAKAASGKKWTAYGVTEEPDTGPSDAQRRNAATGAVQRGSGLENDQTFQDAQALIAGGQNAALAGRPRTFRAYGQVEGHPRIAATGPSQEEARRRLREEMAQQGYSADEIMQALGELAS